MVPGFLDRFQRHRFVALPIELVDLLAEAGPGHVEVGVGDFGLGPAEDVVLE